jgi:hypothetical protein
VRLRLGDFGKVICQIVQHLRGSGLIHTRQFYHKPMYGPVLKICAMIGRVGDLPEACVKIEISTWGT